MNPEVHYSWCLEKSRGDERVAHLMMESAAELEVEFGMFHLWVLGNRQKLDARGI